MEVDPDLQQALFLSLGTAGIAATDHGDSAATVDSASGQQEDDEAELQRALLLSLEKNPSCASSAQSILPQDAPEEIRKLIRTVASNLRRTLPANAGTNSSTHVNASCAPADAAKYRQLKDDAVRKRATTGADPDAAYEVAARALRGLGFQLQEVCGAAEQGADAVAKCWVLPMEANPDAGVLEELSVDRGNIHRGTATQGPSEASVPVAPLPKPRCLSDFDALELGTCGGLVALRAFAYPRGCTQAVGSSDCLAWAAQTGSRGTRWGYHGRVGDDDRVMLTVLCGFGTGSSDCAVHWYNHRGDEQVNPTMLCNSGQWRWCTTYTNQTFVVRLLPQQQMAVCAIKVLDRPYDTRGHVILMLVPSGSGNLEPISQCGQVLTSLPEDSREPTQQRQGRPPPPPPVGHRRR